MKNILIFVFIFAGCSSQYQLGDGAKSIEEKALEINNLKGAPVWVFNGGSGGFSSIGSATISDAGLQFARTEALALARDELARMVAVKVEGVISNAMKQSMDSTYNIDFDKYGKQVTNQVVSQTITGSKQKDMWITTDGKQIYILLELDSSLAQKAKDIIVKGIKDRGVPVKEDKFSTVVEELINDIF